MTTPPPPPDRSRTMSPEGRALLRRTRSSGLLRSPMLFDVLHSLEHDMREAAAKRSVLVADWVSYIKRSETHRSAVIQALFLVVAASGFTADDIRRLRLELQSVTPSRRRSPKLIHQPEARRSQSLF